MKFGDDQITDLISFKIDQFSLQKIFILMKKMDLETFKNLSLQYLMDSKIYNYKDLYSYKSFLNMLLSYYSDIYLKTNIQKESFVINELAVGPYFYKYLINKNKKIILKIIKRNSDIYHYFSESELNDIDIMKSVISQDFKAFTKSGENIKNNKEIALIAIKQNKKDGEIYQSLSNFLKNDIDIIFQTLKTNSWLFNDMNDKIKNNTQVIEYVLKINPDCFMFLSDKYKNIYQKIIN